MSKPVRISLPDHIGACVESCSVRIRKYRRNSQVIEVGDAEMHPVRKLEEDLKASIKNGNADNINWIEDEQAGFIRCPNCSRRLSRDYMMYRTACPTCGCPHKVP